MGGRSAHCDRRVGLGARANAGSRSLRGAVGVSYLKLKRARIILGCFLMSALVLAGFPAIDIGISSIFFEQGFLLRELRWYSLFREGLTYLLCLSMTAVLGIYVFNRLSKRDFCRINGRKVSYLFLVLILGVGLVVNVIFKDSFGRARPRDIEEFGGSKQFTPAFFLSDQCDTNCSFSSGEGAAGFFSLALALALSRRRAALLVALGLGGLVSFLRVASGAHFFSDIVVCFFVMLIFTDVLYYYVVLPKAERDGLLVSSRSDGSEAQIANVAHPVFTGVRSIAVCSTERAPHRRAGDGSTTRRD
jgi:lipid A 4'-phosphatase